MGLRGVPLAEIRRRYGAGGEPVTAAALRALRGDSRAGARDLAAALEARRRRAAAERRRLARLFRSERALAQQGVNRVAGVDEVGIGPLAGPVVAAAVILPAEPRLAGLNDSKRLGEVARIRLDREIRAAAVGVAIGVATLEEIDRLNVYRAGLLAMRRAVEQLRPPPEVALVDARTIPELGVPQRAVRGGDGVVGSIAAASIVAKVYRDTWMSELERSYPGYGFARNRGYGTAQHLRALAERGPTPQHRLSFAPVRAAASRSELVTCPTS